MADLNNNCTNDNFDNAQSPQPTPLKSKGHSEGVSKRQKIFKDASTIIFAVVMVAVIAITAYHDFFGENAHREPVSLQTIGQILSSNWFCIIFALLFLGLSFLFKGLKNATMCKALTKKARFKLSLETAIIGTYYNNVTPLAVGGQPFEIYHLSKHGVRGGAAASIPIASFFLNQIAFVVLAVFSLIFFSLNTFNAPTALLNAFPDTFIVLTIIGCFCCIFMPSLIVLFCLMPKLGTRIVYYVIKLGAKLRLIKDPNKLLTKTIKTVVHNATCLKKIARNVPAFILLFALSFLENFCTGFIAYFVLKTFGLNFGLGFFNELIIVAMICYMLFASVTFVPTPGNSGAADLSFYVLFSSALVSGLAFPAMMTWRICSFYATLLIGLALSTHVKNRDIRRLKANKSIIDGDGEFNEDVEIPDYIQVPIIDINLSSPPKKEK